VRIFYLWLDTKITERLYLFYIGIETFRVALQLEWRIGKGAEVYYLIKGKGKVVPVI